MERIRGIILMAVMVLAFQPSHAQQTFSDKVQYGRYAKANAELKENPRAVFMGNSITEGWVTGSKCCAVSARMLSNCTRKLYVFLQERTILRRTTVI